MSNVLLTVWGYRLFRPPQRAIINAAMDGKDVFVVLPTGGGKSLTYQLPALLEEGLTVVVCPLISLIQDQVSALRAQSVHVRALAGHMDGDEARDTFAQLHRPQLLLQPDGMRLLYVTPERFVASESFMRALQTLNRRGRRDARAAAWLGPRAQLPVDFAQLPAR
eukprot:6181449-Pleurochrysis_carterae.AAC.4